MYMVFVQEYISNIVESVIDTYLVELLSLGVDKGVHKQIIIVWPEGVFIGKFLKNKIKHSITKCCKQVWK